MTRFRFLVPALLFAAPALAQTQQPPTITQMQQLNNGMASTMQFMGAVKSTIEQQSALIDAYKDELAKVTKERDDAIKERDALKPKEPDKK
jgi:maltose-binding protein MalE